MSLKGNSNFTLNIGLYYSPKENQYLVYRANAEVYSQLGVSVEQFQKQMFVLTSLNGVPVEQVTAAFDPVLPYSNPLTRKTYAGIFLGSSKGLLYLSSLMKRGLFPTSDEALTLEFKSRVTGQLVRATVHPQALSDWSIDDLLNKVEGRSAKIVPTDGSPQAVADAYGWKFSEIEPGVFLFKIPSWAPDLVNSKNTIPSRQALYQFVEQSMARLDGHPNAKLILDVRGNRGGDVILWRPIIQKLMKDKAVVTGVFQLNSEMQAVYPKYRGLTPQQSLALAEHKDYFDYSYYSDDPDLSPAAKTAIEQSEAHLSKSGKLKGGVLFADPRFSKPLYEVIEKPDATILDCDVTVIADRFGFSANDTFLGAIKSSLSKERLTIYGEKTEGGSGTGGKILLAGTNLSMSSGSFVSYDSEGKLFESDFLVPDHALELPIESFYEKDHWYQEQVLRSIKLKTRASHLSCKSLF
jgi:hypothetical protein